MATYFDVHPVDPQPRSIAQVVRIMRDGGVVAYPTDSGFALGCLMGNQDGLARMRHIRHLDDKHHFTLLCKDFAQLGQLVHIDNSVFRAIKAATPGSSEGELGTGPVCYQAFQPLPVFDGKRPVLGAWVVDGEPAGLGIRESPGLITDAGATFVPHVIAG